MNIQKQFVLATTLSVLALVLGFVSYSSAAYNMGLVGKGVSGDYFFQLWCQGSHDPQNYYRMNGVVGGTNPNSPYDFWWIGGKCANGGATANRGFVAGTTAVGYCNTGWYVNGIAGYATTTRIGALYFSCNNSSGQEYYLGQLGANTSGSYGSARCANQDVAWGLFGTHPQQDGTSSRLRTLGLICGPS